VAPVASRTFAVGFFSRFDARIGSSLFSSTPFLVSRVSAGDVGADFSEGEVVLDSLALVGAGEVDMTTGSGLILGEVFWEESCRGILGESIGSSFVPESACALTVSFRARPEALLEEPASGSSSSMDGCTILGPDE
jgi:hypothetical protein